MVHLNEGLLPQSLPSPHGQRRVDVGVPLPLVRHGVIAGANDCHDGVLLQVPHYLPLRAHQLSALVWCHSGFVDASAWRGADVVGSVLKGSSWRAQGKAQVN